MPSPATHPTPNAATPPTTAQCRAALGARGEQLAVEHLTAQGLVVLDRNWRCSEGELDIIATDGASVVVVEVKARSGIGYGRPEEAVTPRKLARMRRAAQRWLSANRVGWVQVRFDVVAVLIDPRTGGVQLEHLPGVF